MIFARPYFVTPHAVRQFQQRVANLPARKVIEIVQQALQKPDLVEPPTFRGFYGRKPFYMMVGLPSNDGDWPAVITIMGPESRIHGKLMKRARLAREEGDRCT